MRRAADRIHHREQLSADGAACARFVSRLADLIRDLHLASREAEDAATGDAMVAMANALADTGHDAAGDLLGAHDAACDEEGILSCAEVPVVDYMTLGMKLPTPEPVAMAAE